MLYNYMTNVNTKTANNNRRVFQYLLSTTMMWMTNQTNVFFIAYYRQALNKQTTRQGFFVAYYWRPQNKLMSIPTMILQATQHLLIKLLPTNGMFPLTVATYNRQLMTLTISAPVIARLYSPDIYTSNIKRRW